MILLRRRHRLDPLDITTSPAPVLGGPHVDVDEGGVRIVGAPVPAFHVEGSVSFEIDEQSAAVLRSLDPDDRQPVDRGTCWHHLHFEYDGRRFGALVHEHQHSASLLPCPYVGRAGR